jgi:hypothetical protein
MKDVTSSSAPVGSERYCYRSRHERARCIQIAPELDGEDHDAGTHRLT